MENLITERITMDPGIFGGKPIIRNMRFKVTDIIDLLAAGMTNEEILTDYPFLELDDIRAALSFASLKLSHPVLHAV